MNEAPSPVQAERAVLGSVVLRPDLAGNVRLRLRPDDFGHPVLRHLALLLWRMIDNEEPIDPQLVLAKAMEKQPSLDTRISPVDIGPLIHDCIRSAYAPASVDYYAEIVSKASRQRSLDEIGRRLLDNAFNEDPDVTVMEVMDELERVTERRSVDNEPSMPAESLAFIHVAEEDFILPGRLERDDRMLLCGMEGGGKSIMVRQLCIAAAAGMDPFYVGVAIPQRKVLMVDCENGLKKSKKYVLPLLDMVRQRGFPTEGRLRIQTKPEGLDLTSPHDAAWLLNRVAVDQPDLLAVGPLYKLHATDLNEEGNARVIAKVLDAARLRGGGCALVTETHAAHGEGGGTRNLRPKGSQLWRAWPDMIRAVRPIEKAKDYASFEVAGRGDRDHRDWPEYLTWGNQLRGQWTTWPWLECSEMDYDNAIRRRAS